MSTPQISSMKCLVSPKNRAWYVWFIILLFKCVLNSDKNMLPLNCWRILVITGACCIILWTTFLCWSWLNISTPTAKDWKPSLVSFSLTGRIAIALPLLEISWMNERCVSLTVASFSFIISTTHCATDKGCISTVLKCSSFPSAIARTRRLLFWFGKRLNDA